jgi:hypothetical protein
MHHRKDYFLYHLTVISPEIQILDPDPGNPYNWILQSREGEILHEYPIDDYTGDAYLPLFKGHGGLYDNPPGMYLALGIGLSHIPTPNDPESVYYDECYSYLIVELEVAE